MAGNCTAVCKDVNVIWKLNPNPDVSGIGVIVGFVGTGYFTVLVLFFYYLLCYEPEVDPFTHYRDPERKRERPNAIDKLLLGFRPKGGWIDNKVRSWSRVGRFFEKTILIFADIQLLTGFGLLIAGYGTLSCKDRGISQWHWQIMVYTVWFSTMTHCAALTALRRYLYNRPRERFIRLIAMCSLMIMLLIAMVIGYGFVFAFTGDLKGWGGSPAACAFTSGGWDSQNIASEAYISIAIVVLNFITRAFRAHKASSTAMGKKVRSSMAHWTRRGMLRLFQWAKVNRLEECSWPVRLIYYPTVSGYLLCRLWVDIFTSMGADVIWLLVATAWGTNQLVMAKLTAPLGNENAWTFGQIIPVALLAGPILGVVENLLPEGFGHNTPTVEPDVLSPEPDDHWNQVENMEAMQALEMETAEQHSVAVLESTIPELTEAHTYNRRWYRWVEIFGVLLFLYWIILLLTADMTQTGGVLDHLREYVLWMFVGSTLTTLFLILIGFVLEARIPGTSWGNLIKFYIFCFCWIFATGIIQEAWALNDPFSHSELMQPVRRYLTIATFGLFLVYIGICVTDKARRTRNLGSSRTVANERPLLRNIRSL